MMPSIRTRKEVHRRKRKSKICILQSRSRKRRKKRGMRRITI